MSSQYTNKVAEVTVKFDKQTVTLSELSLLLDQAMTACRAKYSATKGHPIMSPFQGVVPAIEGEFVYGSGTSPTWQIACSGVTLTGYQYYKPKSGRKIDYGRRIIEGAVGMFKIELTKAYRRFCASDA